jgi:hypothetical protein
MSVQQPSWEQKKKKKKGKENRRVRDSFLHAIYYSIFPAGDRSSFVLLHLILIYPHFLLVLSFFLLNTKKTKRLFLIAFNIRDSLFFFLVLRCNFASIFKNSFPVGLQFLFYFLFFFWLFVVASSF